jgi:hypothetical protein
VKGCNGLNNSGCAGVNRFSALAPAMSEKITGFIFQLQSLFLRSESLFLAIKVVNKGLGFMRLCGVSI